MESSNSYNEIYFREKIEKFINSPHKKCYFPCYYNSEERKIIYSICKELNLKTKSIGQAPNKFILINKSKKNRDSQSDSIARSIFIKDFNLPIPISKSPYFEYFLELTNDMYNSKEKYELFKDALEILKKRNKGFMEYTHELREKIITTIKELQAYKELSVKNKNLQFPENTQIYVIENTNWPKYYISFDIIKANFTSLKYHNKEIVLNCESYEELISKFTDIKYFQYAKYFRQVLFGKLNKSNICNLQKQMLSKLFIKIKDDNEKNNFGLIVKGKISDDELLIQTTEEKLKNDFKNLNAIFESLEENFKNCWKIEVFKIYPILPTDMFVKEIFTDPLNSTNTKKIFKCITKELFAQVYKYYNNLEVVPYDLKTSLTTKGGEQIVTFDKLFLDKEAIVI